MTKLTILLLCGTAFLGAADKKETKKPVNQQPPEVTIPAGAQETEDGSFRYTDAKGKKWIYRKTPFGIAKSEEKPPAAQPEQEDTLTKATVKGDSVHFERPTPFGVTKWDKKMTELDANEQRILDRQKNKQ
ncbi:MAG: hypothetical protein JWO80_2154 [Bryobacterales bacterium]|nr:hypothetical protein [Bryobacterales bacterium]